MHPESSLDQHLLSILGNLDEANDRVARISQILSPASVKEGGAPPPAARAFSGVLPMASEMLSGLIELNSRLSVIEDTLVGKTAIGEMPAQMPEQAPRTMMYDSRYGGVTARR